MDYTTVLKCVLLYQLEPPRNPRPSASSIAAAHKVHTVNHHACARLAVKVKRSMGQ